ncbi:tripartite tricarboxylate transporter TctB family protein [Leptospira interrogans]
MIERLINLTWILLGSGAAVLSWRIGLTGPYGPDSGLFPFIAGILVCAGGVALMLARSHSVAEIQWPDKAGWTRIIGVLGGLAFMAATIPYLGFAVSGVITMLILLRTVEQSSWLSSVVLAVVSVAVTLGLFVYVLDLQLPRGPWGF